MNCNEIRELISSMLDHELSAEDSAVVTEHLAECPECMRVFEAFHAISVSLEELEDVPEGFTEAVMHKINTPAPVKKRRPGYLRLAGLAACLALVIITGSQFVTFHHHSDGRTIQDTSEYARVIHQTPKPTSTPAVTAEIAALSDEDVDSSPDSGGADTDFDSVSENTEAKIVSTPAVSAEPEATPKITPTPVPAETPRPTATPQPTPVAAPTALTSLKDLLYAAEAADLELFTEQPDYELSVQNENGKIVALLIWFDGERIYCKNSVEGTAWYAVGTPEILKSLIDGTPVSSPVPSPEADEAA